MNASDISDINTENLALTQWVWLSPADPSLSSPISSSTVSPASVRSTFDLWKPLRRWLDRIDVQNAKLAHSICKLIPAQCPFERDITVFGHTLFHVPPMCKLNPVYDQVVALRFRALCYLADVCGEDVTPYC